MHDIKAIRDNPQAFDAAFTRRGLAPIADSLIKLDETRRAAILESEKAQARRNAASKEIGDAKKAKDNARADALMAEVAELKTTMPALEAAVKEADEALKKALSEIPNLPLDEVPEGADEHGNVDHHRFGAKRDYAFTPKAHYDLGEALGMMDFEAAAKISGARFVVLKKGLARLERAIGQFFLDVHTGEHGYTEVNPPLLVRDDAMFGTAQLPKFREDQFQTVTEEVRRRTIVEFVSSAMKLGASATDAGGSEFARQLANEELVDFSYAKMPERFWLIPTAEVSLTNLVRESILDEKELPMRLTALTPCFRAEAGAAGRDTRGMIRQHQFTKVELVSITTPEQSKDEHERMLSCAEEVLRRLGLHYRVMTLCTGDMGFASQKTYDIEVWMPGQGEGGAYREISSCSVCGDFQARRMDARSRGPDGKPRFVHTLNGSGTAVGRALIAVIENYQQEDGSIAVPDALQPYMGGLKVIAK
ncbi:seryl-tRNA synthetase [Rhodopseudomonas palustris HaA2]|uniref:Serine--tRNA ligase n=1 Tax=Rhodopseudomonas palustris (strain HaA2) TaxID=316058 RepID=SYS_RHOP2|nr:serine--tRNA ligase [Rhodopseudomonas palustris]Q2IWG6.1 RecName: Full=Serine--tRNA ligase; AltName: Full=Seryl-tRNA synthetase; Short=SerRS; AltName: Full=Seryl-tRNA(Ser/Sec) synthetase [Rhodopseudomonas palustris HaA2]ABD07444.1 seryl-tRNA synthetase [Rhodopseudomonas palustris HaA2]